MLYRPEDSNNGRILIEEDGEEDEEVPQKVVITEHGIKDKEPNDRGIMNSSQHESNSQTIVHPPIIKAGDLSKIAPSPITTTSSTSKVTIQSVTKRRITEGTKRPTETTKATTKAIPITTTEASSVTMPLTIKPPPISKSSYTVSPTSLVSTTTVDLPFTNTPVISKTTQEFTLSPEFDPFNPDTALIQPGTTLNNFSQGSLNETLGDTSLNDSSSNVLYYVGGGILIFLLFLIIWWCCFCRLKCIAFFPCFGKKRQVRKRIRHNKKPKIVLKTGVLIKDEVACLQTATSINSFWSANSSIKSSVAEIDFQNVFNETKSKATIQSSIPHSVATSSKEGISSSTWDSSNYTTTTDYSTDYTSDYNSSFYTTDKSSLSSIAHVCRVHKPKESKNYFINYGEEKWSKIESDDADRAFTFEISSDGSEGFIIHSNIYDKTERTEKPNKRHFLSKYRL